MADLGGYNPADHEPAVGFSAIPAGVYEAIIVSSERKVSKSNPNNSYLNVEFSICGESPYAGQKLFAILNLWNSNAIAKRNADNELAMICQAAGITTVLNDSEELHDIPIQLKIVIETRRDTSEKQNRIKGYYPAGEVVPTVGDQNQESDKSKTGW